MKSESCPSGSPDPPEKFGAWSRRSEPQSIPLSWQPKWAPAVDAGLQHFADVTRGFKQIATLVVTSTEAAREIEISTKQQMTAVEQVNTAIKDAAEATRETEASSSQTLQTATQLAHLSQDLSRIVQPLAKAASA
jgi:hypothetical protein